MMVSADIVGTLSWFCWVAMLIWVAVRHLA